MRRQRFSEALVSEFQQVGACYEGSNQVYIEVDSSNEAQVRTVMAAVAAMKQI